jgi:hypothetical protein
MRSCVRRLSRGWVRCLAGGVLIATSVPGTCGIEPAVQITPSEVEAAYLYNFAKFVRWPEGAIAPSAPFAICILSEDGFGQTLDSMVANETLQGHKIVARRISSILAAGECQIVFLGRSEEPRLSKDLATLEKKPVLTVSNMLGFLEGGGMIQLVLQNSRVRFAVNLTAAEQTGLSLSSELLKVAVHVDSKPLPAKPAQEAKP